MGQRTQLFVTAETAATTYSQATRHRVGRHHQWRYGPHMAICAAQVIEHLNAVTTGRYYRPSEQMAEGVAAIYGVNRATAEVSGIDLYDDVSTLDAKHCDNNNGTFLVNLDSEGYTFGFLVGPENGGDLDTVTGINGLMTAFPGADWANWANWEEASGEEGKRWAATLASAMVTLSAAEADGHLMAQDTATRVASATAPEWKTITVWDRYTAKPAPYAASATVTTTA